MMFDSLTLLADFDILGQRLSTADIAVVGLLVLLEGVLSIDNALVLGILAKRLPPKERSRALSYGLIGAFVFRVIAICLASLLLRWTIIKFVGGAYLAYISIKHLFFESKEEGDDSIVFDEAGNPKIVDSETGEEISAEREDLEIRERVPLGTSLVLDSGDGDKTTTETEKESGGRGPYASFWGTVLVIELTDIAFAVDSILAAMAMAGSKQEKLWVVVTGGILGVILMRFAAAIFIRLLEKFPRFETSAYLLVLVIGVKLLGEWGFNSDWSFNEPAWAGRTLGTWKQTFEGVEKSRLATIHSYENWMRESWPLGFAEHAVEHAVEPPKPEVEPPALSPEQQAQKVAAEQQAQDLKRLQNQPHLLDFHSPRRPECLLFWIIMAICFAVGFVPRKSAPK